MELSILLMKQIGVMLIIVAFGWLTIRLKLLKVEDSKAMSILTLYVICPCVIIHSFQIKFDIVKLQGFGLAILGSCIAQFFLLLAGRLSRPIFKLTPIEEGSIGYPNVGILIIPIVMATMGEKWVFYCSAYIAVQTVMMWTHGKTLVCADGWNLKKILCNINVIAIILGIVLFISNIALPPVLDSSLKYVGNMVGPISMLIIGMLLGSINFKEIFTRKRAYLITFLNMLVFPTALAAIFVLSRISGLHKDGAQILTITVMAAAAPPASTITQFAQIFDKDAKYASILNMMGVLVCIMTMPLIVLLYKEVLSN